MSVQIRLADDAGKPVVRKRERWLDIKKGRNYTYTCLSTSKHTPATYKHLANNTLQPTLPVYTRKPLSASTFGEFNPTPGIHVKYSTNSSPKRPV